MVLKRNRKWRGWTNLRSSSSRRALRASISDLSGTWASRAVLSSRILSTNRSWRSWSLLSRFVMWPRACCRSLYRISSSDPFWCSREPIYMVLQNENENELSLLHLHKNHLKITDFSSDIRSHKGIENMTYIYKLIIIVLLCSITCTSGPYDINLIIVLQNMTCLIKISTWTW